MDIEKSQSEEHKSDFPQVADLQKFPDNKLSPGKIDSDQDKLQRIRFFSSMDYDEYLICFEQPPKIQKIKPMSKPDQNQDALESFSLDSQSTNEKSKESTSPKQSKKYKFEMNSEGNPQSKCQSATIFEEEEEIEEFENVKELPQQTHILKRGPPQQRIRSFSDNIEIQGQILHHITKKQAN